jgi:hypothetical protein
MMFARLCATAFSTLVTIGFAMAIRHPASAQTPMQITTDTPAYCRQLLDRVSELVQAASEPPPGDVTSLAAEGEKMCAEGEVRGGILRLRRAVMLLLSQSSNPRG